MVKFVKGVFNNVQQPSLYNSTNAEIRFFKLCRAHMCAFPLLIKENSSKHVRFKPVSAPWLTYADVAKCGFLIKGLHFVTYNIY